MGRLGNLVDGGHISLDLVALELRHLIFVAQPLEFQVTLVQEERMNAEHLSLEGRVINVIVDNDIAVRGDVCSSGIAELQLSSTDKEGQETCREGNEALGEVHGACSKEAGWLWASIEEEEGF